MFDREFIVVPRVMDDCPMYCRIADIIMITVNADEHGPQEGTSAIYFREGLAIAVNKTPDEVIGLIHATELTQ